MVAKELISNLIPSLKETDSGDRALIWMHEFNVVHLPVVQNGKFLGLISEEDILDLDDPSQSLASYNLALYKPQVNDGAHAYEVIKMAAELHISLVPVVDEKDNYIGVIPLENIVRFFAQISAINENGSIIILELNKNDYSLSEISRIVESNNSNILSSYVSTHKDSMKLEVTLKISSTEIKQVISTFERFNYKVSGSYQETEYFEGLKDRFDSLMSYLNV